MTVERFIIEISLLLILLTPMFEDTSTMQNENSVNDDKEYFNGDNQDVFSNVDPDSTQREVKPSVIDRNIHSLNDYNYDHMYGLANERKSIDYKSLKKQCNTEKPKNESDKNKNKNWFKKCKENTHNLIRTGKARSSTRNEKAPKFVCANKKHRLHLNEINSSTTIPDRSMNECNREELLKPLEPLKEIESENADIEESEDYHNQDEEDINKSAKGNKENDENLCTENNLTPLTATLHRLNTKIQVPDQNDACSEENRKSEGKADKDDKNKRKNLGVLQPANQQRIAYDRITAYKECLNSRSGIAGKRQHGKTKQLQHKFQRKYMEGELSSDTEDYNKASRKLMFAKSKLKTKPYMRHRYEHALRYNRKHLKSKDIDKKDATDDSILTKEVSKLYKKNIMNFPFNYETIIKDSKPESKPPMAPDSDMSFSNSHRSTDTGRELILDRQKSKNTRSLNARTPFLREANANNNGFFPLRPVPDYLSNNGERSQKSLTNNHLTSFVKAMLLNETSKPGYYEPDYVGDSNPPNDNNEFNSVTSNRRSGALVEDPFDVATLYVNNNKSHGVNSENIRDIEAKEVSMDKAQYSMKRSITNKDHELMKSANEHTTDLSYKDENADSNDRKPDAEKSIGVNYDEDRNDYNNDDNANNNNRNTSDLDQSNEDDEKRQQRIENYHRKKLKPQSFTKGSTDDDTDNHKQTYYYNDKKPGQMKTKQENQMTKNDPKVTATVSYISPKKYTEPRYKEHTSVKSSDKQCHPPAGPPKFKWCSDEAGSGRDQEYEDALKGRIALRIVEVILAKVHKSSKMSHDFGFCRNDKKGGNTENNCGPDSSILKSQDLKEIMTSMKKLSCKNCNQLPPKLKEFLQWLIKVKTVRSVHTNDRPFGKYSNCSLGESAFLFHEYDAVPRYESQNLVADDHESCDNSQYTANCDYDQIKKVQDDVIVNKELKLDLDPLQNSLSLDADKELYNTKLKRYATENEDNYHYSESSIAANEQFESPFRTRNDINPKYLYSNQYADNLNSYEYYLNNANNFKSRKQSERFNRSPWPVKNSIHGANEPSSFPYNGDRFSKRIPFDNFQSKADENYESNDGKHYEDDLYLTRKKRNHKNLQLQELTSDKLHELQFEDEFKRANMDDQLREMFSDNGEVDQMADTSDDSSQSLGFYNPVVFRIPGEYGN